MKPGRLDEAGQVRWSRQVRCSRAG